MPEVIFSTSVFWVLLPSPAGLFMLVLLAEGVYRFWQENSNVCYLLCYRRVWRLAGC